MPTLQAPLFQSQAFQAQALQAQLLSAQASDSSTSDSAASSADTLQDACGADPGWLCRQLFELTDSSAVASIGSWAIEVPFKILLIVFGAWLVRRLSFRAIDRFVDRLVNERHRMQAALKDEVEEEGKLYSPTVLARRIRTMGEQSERSNQRAHTLGALFKSIASAAIGVVTVIMVLGEFNVSLGPLIAGAGIIGVAVGFGSQAVVSDLLTGIFMLIEDQYGVGDVIDVGEVSGTVESIGLRTTRIRDSNGTLWFIPNGVIKRVGNKTQGWSKLVLDVDVAYDTDLDEAMALIKSVADELWREQPEATTILEEPTVSGVQHFGPDGISLRLVAKTDPAEQWATGRELRRRLKRAMDEAGIEIPFPQRTIWVKHEGAPDGDKTFGGGGQAAS